MIMPLQLLAFVIEVRSRHRPIGPVGEIKSTSGKEVAQC